MADETQNTTNQTTVSDFLKQNVESGEQTKEVKLKRFKSPFIIRAISASESDELSKEATTKRRDKRTGQTISTIDQKKYGDLLIVKAVVQPDLNNKEIQESYGTIADPIGTLNSMLMAGELATISQEVMDINGIDDDNVDTVAEQAKK